MEERGRALAALRDAVRRRRGEAAVLGAKRRLQTAVRLSRRQLRVDARRWLQSELDRARSPAAFWALVRRVTQGPRPLRDALPPIHQLTAQFQAVFVEAAEYHTRKGLSGEETVVEGRRVYGRAELLGLREVVEGAAATPLDEPGDDDCDAFWVREEVKGRRGAVGAGPDNLPGRLCWRVGQLGAVATLLAVILKSCEARGEWPLAWRVARVTPLAKATGRPTGPDQLQANLNIKLVFQSRRGVAPKKGR